MGEVRFPFEAADAAKAVCMFFENRVTFQHVSVEHRTDCISVVELYVRTLFDRKDIYELAFVFECGTLILEGPQRLVDFLGDLVPDGIMLALPKTLPCLVPRGDAYVLCVTPYLVTFAGNLVWDGFAVARRQTLATSNI